MCATNKTIQILYAEDNSLDIDLTLNFFKEETKGMEITIVESGNEVFERLKQKKFDLLLLDYKLPDIDGVEIIKKIRLANNNIPIILLTGMGDEKLILQSLKSGANHYLPKKGDYLSELPPLINQLVSSFEDIKHDYSKTNPHPNSILYIEDSTVDIDLLQTYFKENAKHLIVTAVNTGDKALELLKAPNKFDLVLCDLQLQNMNAIELMRETKKAGIQIPFIIITGKGNEHYVMESIKMGALDYVIKSDTYIAQLPYVIENALVRFENMSMHKKHIDDINLLTKKLERKLEKTTLKLNKKLKQFESTEKLLKQQTRELSEINRVKDQFFSLLAHDLRSPFNGMLGILDFIFENYETFDQVELKEHIGLAKSTTQNVYNLLDNLLEWSRTQQGKVQVNNHVFLLNDVFGKIKDLYNIIASQKGINFLLNCNKKLEVYADENIVYTVLRNLVSNAIKFTPKGGEVNVSARQNEENIIITVSDTGVGISAEVSKKMFKIDEFGSKPGTNGEKGTGLGLILSKQLLSLCYGSISFTTIPGKGTVFTVKLPNKLK